MDFVSNLISCQKTRDIHVTYGKVCLKPATGDEDSTMYIKGDPVTVMFEFTRMKDVDVLDLFITFDTDGSHSVTWEEFKEGVQVQICITFTIYHCSMLVSNLRKNINFLSLLLKEKNLQVRLYFLLSISKVSKIPVRMRDLDTIIKRIDINLDGEINFS